MNSNATQSTSVRIRNAAKDSIRATGMTHPLYRYPASMSPILAKELIVNLTEPGDTVLDPFCGGGTTAIESLSNGRKVICSDINALASFVTMAKAWPLRESSLIKLEQWFGESSRRLRRSDEVDFIPVLTRTGKEYSPKTHGLLLSLRNLASRIPQPPVRRVALLIALQVGKLCFDCREKPPSPRILIRKFEEVYHKAILSANQYSSECYKWGFHQNITDNLKVYNCSILKLADKLAKQKRKVDLVLTSPPYPGTHVLYNRWQIHGRGETDLPYNLLHLQDGQSTSFYTFGDRNEAENRTYFEQLERAFQELREVLERFTLLAQVISFPDPKRQLSRYRRLMETAGYKEVFLDRTHRNVIRREIPNRRWYAKYNDGATPAIEYIIIHKPR